MISARHSVPSRYLARDPTPRGHFAPPPGFDANPDERQDFVAILRKLWRQRLLLLGFVLLGAGLAWSVGSSMPSHYVADARVLVGVPQPQLFRADDDAAISEALTAESTRAQNESYVLQSRDLAKQVVDKLGLADNPNFNGDLATPMGPLGWLQAMWHKALGSGSAAEDPDRREQRIVDQFVNDAVAISPLGRSNVVDIAVDTTNPGLSATIANTLANAYLDQKRSTQLGSTNRVEGYMNDRIAELRQQVQQSEQSVEDYRRQYGLYRTGNDSMTAQTLGEMNSQLVLAETAKAEADAKLSEATTLSGRGVSGDSVPDVLQSPLVQQLKEQQATAARTLAQVKATYGARHPKVQDAQAELTAIEHKVAAEIGHTIDGLRHQAAAADERYATLSKSLQGTKTQMGSVNDKAIHLEALEREAAVNRKLLEDMLARAKQTIGRQEVQQIDAKLISPAAPPLWPNYPPRTLILLLGAIVGALVGAMLALLRDGADLTFRRAEQVEASMGLPVMTLIPNVGGGRSPASSVLRDPLSHYGEALRRLYVMLAMSETAHSPRTVLFGSAVPGEGKSVTVVSLCRLLANSGKRVLLVDCDWRSPTAHKFFQRPNEGGLEAILTNDNAQPLDFVFRDSHSGLDFIPSGRWNPHNAHLLNSKRMAEVLDCLAQHYELVVLDTPPVLVGAEVLPLASFVDKVVLVVRWGHTRRVAVLEAAKQLLEARADVAGIALSRVDTKRYGQYEYTAPYFAQGQAAFTRVV